MKKVLLIYSVKLASVDNYAIGKHEYAKESLFQKLYYAINHNEILNLNLESIKEINATRVDKLLDLFKELKYYEQR